MKRKSTDDLREELMSSPNLDRFLDEHREEFESPGISQLLNELLQKKRMSKAALAKQSGISEVYLYQVFAGKRKPSRSKVLCLCFGLKATLEETQELLKRSGYAQLYLKNRRDAILIHSLVNGTGLFEVNDKLFSEGEETLF